MSRPNILLITTDQQRYDTLGCNGAPIGRTPVLDSLAARGMIFDQCYDQNPVCIPSRACLQTGRYTHQHGVRYMENEIDTTPGLPPWELTFFERLREVGYHTAAFGKIHMMPERGFDTMHVTGGKGGRWTQITGQPIGPAPLGWDYGNWVNERLPGGYEKLYEQRRKPEYKEYRGALVHALPAELHVETWIANNTVEFLESRPDDEPWFCWCGFTGPHGPLDVPPEYVDHYDIDNMPLPAHWEIDLSDRFPYRGRGVKRMSEKETWITRLWIAYYHGLMDLIDDQTARLIEVMDRKGFWDNTLVMYTSDHGEMRGDFGLYGKGNFYDPVTRVPTFVIPPGGEVAAPRFDGLIEMFDFAPTALDYAGVEIPEQMAARSLRRELETGEGGREAAFCEFVTNNRNRSGVMCRADRYKLCLWTEGDERGGELYDLLDDPEELRNRWDDPALAGVRRSLAELTVDRWLEVDCPAPRDEWGGAKP